MKVANWVHAGMVGLMLSLPLRAQTTTPATPPRKPVAAPAKPVKKSVESDDLAAIRQQSTEFAQAFNAADAKAIAALWTEDGEYVDAQGRGISGREAIEKEYADFFASHPGAKIQTVIDSLKLLSNGVAIEDGRSVLEPADAKGAGATKYMVVHVKVGDQWLMSTVRDAPAPAEMGRALDDLGWLIGTWVAEENGATTESVCRWVANKNFVERTYTVTHVDKSTASGLQLIGINPQNGQVQSWSFTSDGGYAVAVWMPSENGWTSENHGTTGDGTSTQAVNVLTRLDDNAYSWQSVSRTAGGVSLPDSNEIIIKRKVTTP